MAKLQMKTPLVEMDGDEMTRIIWKMIKDHLLLPLYRFENRVLRPRAGKNRDRTDDRVTVESAEATKKYGVAVKCATITPNAQRVEEYKLKEMWKAPTAPSARFWTAPCSARRSSSAASSRFVSTWKKPITIARHAYGDVYKASETAVPQGARAEIVVTDSNGAETRTLIHDFASGAGVVQGMHNIDGSIASFARSCFNYALATAQDLWFATKDTISKKYDHRFKDIFAEIYEAEYKEKVCESGHRVLLHAHRRRGRARHPLGRRLHLGVQELRRRRDERYGRHGLRFAGDDDERARLAGRHF